MINVRINNLLSSDLCIGCGLCAAIDNSVSIIEKDGQLRPTSIPHNDVIEDCCPALGYNLKEMGRSLFQGNNYRFELGYYDRIVAARSSFPETLTNASSGGIITEIAKYVLTSHYVDGVICTRYQYTDDRVRPLTYVAYDVDDLMQSQGSKYCPTSTLAILNEVIKNPGKRYLLIATPCQIAGFRLYAERNTSIKQQIPLCISNFCGGYRDFRELDFFIHNIAGFKHASFFRHRGGGQPGGMRIENDKGDVFSCAYPDYARLSPYVKVERCSLCMDATGELADISCGDAWLDEFKSNGPWSITIIRSQYANDLISRMVKDGLIIQKRALSETEVITSQKNNLTSKKYRQFNRIKLRSLLLKPSPNWYSDYPVKQGSLFDEARIYFSKERAKQRCK